MVRKFWIIQIFQGEFAHLLRLVDHPPAPQPEDELEGLAFAIAIKILS